MADTERQEAILVRDGKADVYCRDVTEWQCTCGAWVPIGYSRHAHLESKPASFAALHDYRRMLESGMVGVMPDPIACPPDERFSYVLRTKDMPTR